MANKTIYVRKEDEERWEEVSRRLRDEGKSISSEFVVWLCGYGEEENGEHKS